MLPPIHADHLHASASQLLVGGQNIPPGGLNDAAFYVSAVDEDVIDVGGDGVFVHAQAGSGVGLRVKIAEQDGFPGRVQGRSQVDSGGGLADTAFLVCDYNVFCQPPEREYNPIII